MAEIYIAAGALRNRIKILDPTLPNPSVDTFGTPASGQVAPSKVAEVWAQILFVAARAVYSVQQAVAQVSHKVTIRWAPGIAAGQQVYYIDGEGIPRLLQIRDVDRNDEKRRYLILECLERPDLLSLIQTVPD